MGVLLQHCQHPFILSHLPRGNLLVCEGPHFVTSKFPLIVNSNYKKKKRKLKNQIIFEGKKKRWETVYFFIWGDIQLASNHHPFFTTQKMPYIYIYISIFIISLTRRPSQFSHSRSSYLVVTGLPDNSKAKPILTSWMFRFQIFAKVVHISSLIHSNLPHRRLAVCSSPMTEFVSLSQTLDEI